ncbi:hypothetical protein AKJ45_03295 [candidate division MSBL1 archaeon SCGC-AAA261F19]|uniref:Uncharacterized protein n=1 Tax=candidate division MSBL1 archaeon SCGC-AAA261F19 TaxID=1698275 RepID=A0A133V8H7_9EURY|nr:hypothetical protein AKJ45_03295 [candidate division MSBL1 archaeon SCGC-AAA261F19]
MIGNQMVEEDEKGEKAPFDEIAGVPVVFCLKDEIPMEIVGTEIKETEKKKFLFKTTTEEHKHLKYECPECGRYYLRDLERRRGGGCFIATAAYGSPLAKEINVLRRFRDSYLVHREWGRKAISIYYALSPPIAKIIERSESLKKLVRAFLTPIVKFFREKSGK